MFIRLSTVAGLAAALAAGALTVTPSVAAQKKAVVQCMTDDGYGRYRPCSAGYKRAHPDWRAGSECMTDDGYGRLRPCSQLYRQGGGSYAGPYVPSSTFPGPERPEAKRQPAY
jgi:hypothetical protein